MREREERTRFWRAVPSRGQGKEEAKGESGNRQTVKWGGGGGGGGERKLSRPLHCLPPESFSPIHNYPSVSPSFPAPSQPLCFQKHTHSEESFPLPLRQVAFLSPGVWE